MLYYYDAVSLQYKKLDMRLIYVLICLVAIAMFLLSMKKPEVIVKKKYISSEMSVIIKGAEFSDKNFYEYIKLCGIRFPDIVYAQAVLESGNFKSDRFLEHNNAFGMKVARSRPTTAAREYTNHAEYDSWMLCVQDYALYQSAYLRDLRTEEQYFRYLGEHYAEDPSYVDKLKVIIKRL